MKHRTSQTRNLQIEPKRVPKKPHLCNLVVDSEGGRITTGDGWKHKRAGIEKWWKAFLGLDNQFTSKIPLKLQMTLLNNVGSCSRYRLQYNIDGHGHWTVDAYLLVPNAILLKKMPAFVAFHQTTDSHAKEPAGLAAGSSFNMAYGVHLAELGYVVLCPRNYLYHGHRTYSANKTNQWGSDVERIKAHGHDHHELLALIAPRPFLLLAGGSLEPGTRKGNEADDERSWKYIKAVMPVYELLNKPKNIGWWHHKRGHDYPDEAQLVTREFVMKHLPPP